MIEEFHLLICQCHIFQSYQNVLVVNKNFDKMKFLIFDWNCRKYAPLISRISKRLEYFHGKESREFDTPTYGNYMEFIIIHPSTITRNFKMWKT